MISIFTTLLRLDTFHLLTLLRNNPANEKLFEFFKPAAPAIIHVKQLVLCLLFLKVAYGSLFEAHFKQV